MGSKYTFENKTSQGKFNELLHQYNEFLNDETNSSKAEELCKNAWHLVDWVFEEFQNIHLTRSIGDFRDTLYPQCESLKIIHDIANGSKHNKVSRPKASIRSTNKHLGPFSNIFSREFDQTCLEIIMEDGTILLFEDEIGKVVEFWKNYFERNLGT